MPTRLDNDEIEVSCDALWFVALRSQLDAAQQRLFDRLQPLRTGDYGGSAATELDDDEREAVVSALRRCSDEIELDTDERALLARLSTG